MERDRARRHVQEPRDVLGPFPQPHQVRDLDLRRCELEFPGVELPDEGGGNIAQVGLDDLDEDPLIGRQGGPFQCLDVRQDELLEGRVQARQMPLVLLLPMLQERGQRRVQFLDLAELQGDLPVFLEQRLLGLDPGGDIAVDAQHAGLAVELDRRHRGFHVEYRLVESHDVSGVPPAPALPP